MKYWITMAAVACSGMAYADEEVSYGGAVTAFYQSASEDYFNGTKFTEVGNELTTVLDLDVNIKRGPGEWHIYVEGTSTGKDGKVAAVYGDALADAGGAADTDGRGRIQISMLEYYYEVGGGTLIAGLLYPSGFAETGDWTNDETSQFISSPFVNISTIGAPDYAVGIGFQKEADESSVGWSLLASQAQGLGDLDGSYHELFSSVDDDLFLNAEMNWLVAGLDVRVGVWHNDADHDNLNGDGDTDANSGYNVSVAKAFDDQHLLVLRYGAADEDVSEVENFIGLSYQYTGENISAGLGYAVQYASSDLEDSDPAAVEDSRFVEAYVKYQMVPDLYLTGSVQQVKDSGLGLSDAEDDSASIFTLRLSKEF